MESINVFWKGWQVALNFSDKFICGGALINSQWVLTTASCIPSTTALSSYALQLGTFDRRSSESWSIQARPKRIIRHPDYSEFKMSNDIALIKLDVGSINFLLIIKSF